MTLLKTVALWIVAAEVALMLIGVWASFLRSRWLGIAVIVAMAFGIGALAALACLDLLGDGP